MAASFNLGEDDFPSFYLALGWNVI